MTSQVVMDLPQGVLQDCLEAGLHPIPEIRWDPLRYKLTLHRARSCALAGTGSRSALALLLLWAA